MGIPRIQQLGPGWCGHAALSSVLQFWGHDFSQRDIFSHTKEGPGGDVVYGAGAYVSMGELALAAMRLTDLRVTLASLELYEKICKKREDFSPYDLLKDSIANGIPCIMHHLDHFYVIFGFSERNKKYYLKDSRYCGWYVISEHSFNTMWSLGAFKYDECEVNTQYSLLIIRPKK